MFPGVFKPYSHIETFLPVYFDYELHRYFKKGGLLYYHFFTFALLHQLSVLRQC